MGPKLVEKSGKKPSREERLLAELRDLRSRFEALEDLILSVLQPQTAA